MNPAFKQKLKRIAKVSLITVAVIVDVVIAVAVLSEISYHSSERGIRPKIAEFKSITSSMQTALVAECDKPNPNPASITWPSHYTTGSKGNITTPLTCTTAGEISGGAVTLDPKIGNCIATLRQTGVTFVGKDC